MRSQLENEILESIRPTEEELARMHHLADRIMEEIRASGKADGMMVGSVARRTCVRGDRDLDIFMLFDPALPREELERDGLGLAHEIASKHASDVREKYAEHPYVNATIDGVDLDLVPCYRVGKASEIQSAVDRTPFHSRYISARIPGMEDDVLLLKQFVKAGGVYGSDQMTEGFAGYLCELLILQYHGFSNLIQAGASWKAGLVIDIEEHGQKTFDDPLVVIDPVDPCRNVSASVSLTRFYEFVELCRGYIKSPSRWFFYRPQICILRDADVARLLAGRESAFLAITLKTPEFIEDVVVPQLRRSLTGLCDLLKRHEFIIARADAEMLPDRSMLLFELLVDTLPAVKYHAGPPVTAAENAEKFVNKYLNDPSIFAGPYIRDGRYGVEIIRKFRTAHELLSSREVFGSALGKHIKISMEEGYTVHQGNACWQDGFEIFISGFLQKSSPLVRIRRAEQRGEI